MCWVSKLIGCLRTRRGERSHLSPTFCDEARQIGRCEQAISMFLHELSRKVSENWPIRVDGQEYEDLVRRWFNNQCPYCSRSLAETVSVIEHLDGMNRYRAGLHTPGNVLVACKKCNCEKRRDDSSKSLSLANSGWESFLSHDGTRCVPPCLTCHYWRSIWEDETQRRLQMGQNLQKLRSFRSAFSEFERVFPSLSQNLPSLLTKLYSDCQSFAEKEIKTLLDGYDRISDSQT